MSYIAVQMDSLIDLWLWFYDCLLVDFFVSDMHVG